MKVTLSPYLLGAALVALFAAGAVCDAALRDHNPAALVADVLQAARGDTRPPKVAITSPRDGAVVSGPTTITANATDAGGVAGVQFKIGVTDIGAEVTMAPYAVTADVGAYGGGTRTLQAVARDVAGNYATSTITVTVACTAQHACDGSVPTPFRARAQEVVCTSSSTVAFFHDASTCTPFSIQWGDRSSTTYTPEASCQPVWYNPSEGPNRTHTYSKDGAYTLRLMAGTQGQADYINATTTVAIGQCQPQ